MTTRKTSARKAAPRNTPAPAKAVPAARPSTNPARSPAKIETPVVAIAPVTSPIAKPAAAKTVAKPKKAGKKEHKSKADDQPGSKNKLVRDSFTMPATDYALIGALKARTLASGTSVKKSELLRAGLNALAVMPPAQLISLLASMPAVKTGRPGKKK